MPLVLLAMDAEGYSNLCQLTTLRHLGALRLGQETFAEDASRAVTLDELATHSAGVMALWPARCWMDLAGRGTACCGTEKAPVPQNHPGRKERAFPTRRGRCQAVTTQSK